MHLMALFVPSAKSEVDSLQRTGEQRQAEIRQLQKQLSDMERDRHTEVVKLRLEVRRGCSDDVMMMSLQTASGNIIYISAVVYITTEGWEWSTIIAIFFLLSKEA